MKKFKLHGARTLAIILSFLMVVYLIPTAVFAYATEESNEVSEPIHQEEVTFENDSQNSVSSYFPEEKHEKKIEYEILEMREENIKFFLMNDGSYTMTVYSTPIHYKDNYGVWQDINNSGSLDKTARSKLNDTASENISAIAGERIVLNILKDKSEVAVSGLDRLPEDAYIIEARLTYNKITASDAAVLSAESSYLNDTDLIITADAREAAMTDGTCEIEIDRAWSENNSVLSSGSSQAVLTVNYIISKGLESYWSTTSQSVGIAGKGYVNNQTGELTFAIETLTTQDYIMPYTATLIKNGTDDYIIDNESLYSYTHNGENVFKYTDADGTDHFLYKDYDTNKYHDRDGLNLTFDPEEYKLYFPDGTIYDFRMSSWIGSVPDGILYKIIDPSGNCIIRSYDEQYNNREGIGTLPLNSSYVSGLTYRYNSEHRIMYINNFKLYRSYLLYYSDSPDGSGVLSMSEGDYLRKIVVVQGDEYTSYNEWITYPYDSPSDGMLYKVAEMSYSYDSAGRITVARDELQQYEVRYVYDSFGRVIQTSEVAAGQVTGQTISFEYFTDSTRVRSSGTDDILGNSDDLYTNYVFDSLGRTVTSYVTDISGTSLYGATSGQYVNSNDSARNKIKNSVTTTGTYHNIIKNGGFEKYSSAGGAEGWTVTGRVSVNDSSKRLSGYKLEMKPYRSGGVTTAYQDVTLAVGSYSLGFDVDIVNAIDTSFTVTVEGDSIIAEKNVPINEEYAAGGAFSNALTFDITEAGTYRITFTFTAQNSTASTSTPVLLLDDVMLTRSASPAEFSYVENGGFETDVSDIWIADTNTPTSGTLEIENTGGFFGSSLKLGIGTSTSAYQRVYDGTGNLGEYQNTNLNPTEFALYTLFGWARHTDPSVTNTVVRMQVRLTYCSDPNTLARAQYEYEYDFVLDSEAWQYGALTFPINPENGLLLYVDVVLIYGNQTANAYYDDIVLVKECAGVTAFEYNANGYVSYAKQGENDSWAYYDTDNNLVLTADSINNVVINTYDESRRLTSTLAYRHNGRFYPDYQNTGSCAVRADNVQIKTYSEYVYNENGLVTSEKTYGIDLPIGGFLYEGVYLPHYNGETPVPPVEFIPENTVWNKPFVSAQYTYRTTSGDLYFGAIQTETDGLGNVTAYYYIEYPTNWAGLSYVISPNGTGEQYSYDALGNITSVSPIYVNNGWSYPEGEVDYNYNGKKQLSEIVTETTRYGFGYDAFGNTTVVTANYAPLATYQYNAGNGKLNTLIYGNGDKVLYVYDHLDRIKEIKYNNDGMTDVTAYVYKYDASGNVISVTDNLTGQRVDNEYDSAGRLLSSVTSENGVIVSGTHASYDEDGRVSMYRFNYDSATANDPDQTDVVSVTNQFNYDPYGVLRGSYISHGYLRNTVNLTYNDLGSLITKINNVELNAVDKLDFRTRYVYCSDGNSQSSLISQKINSIKLAGSDSYTDTSAFTYEYDENGNIVKEYRNGTLRYQYHYDEKNQLIREDDYYYNHSYRYYYDASGNITKKEKYLVYTYEPFDGELDESYTYDYYVESDYLYSFNGETISYDGIGNPTTYRGNTLTWQNGRELASYNNINYTYDANGIRIKKVNGSDITEYVVDGSTVMRQSWNTGTNNYVADYFYDESGAPLGFAYSVNGGAYSYYFYETNLQGDVTRIFDVNGTGVASFTYDAWGRVVYTWVNASLDREVFLKASLFRYRGYIYDSDTGLYYLQSRYYDPQTGRFINGDGIINANGGVLGNNLYAYCNNNPINYSDLTGNSITAIGVAVVSGVGLLLATAVAGISTLPAPSPSFNPFPLETPDFRNHIFENPVEFNLSRILETFNTSYQRINYEYIPTLIPRIWEYLTEFPHLNSKSINVLYSDSKHHTENQSALSDIAKEIEKNAKNGVFISYQEAQIFDEWAVEYGIPQHHQARIGSGTHYKMGWDHTHFYGKHIPFK